MLIYAAIAWFIFFNAKDLLWLSILLGVFAVFGLSKSLYLAMSDKSEAWKKEFENFKETEERRRKLSTRRANDKLIADILISTSPQNKIDVIKNLRDATGLDVTDARNAVDDYYVRHPELLRLRS